MSLAVVHFCFPVLPRNRRSKMQTGFYILNTGRNSSQIYYGQCKEEKGISFRSSNHSGKKTSPKNRIISTYYIIGSKISVWFGIDLDSAVMRMALSSKQSNGLEEKENLLPKSRTVSTYYI